MLLSFQPDDILALASHKPCPRCNARAPIYRFFMPLNEDRFRLWPDWDPAQHGEVLTAIRQRFPSLQWRDKDLWSTCPGCGAAFVNRAIYGDLSDLTYPFNSLLIAYMEETGETPFIPGEYDRDALMPWVVEAVGHG